MSDPNETQAWRWFSPARFGLLLALLIFAAFPQVLLGLQTFVARDYGFFAYPLALFQKDCFLHGELPLWNPYNNCGVPFLAQWNTMPLYPPALLYLALPLPWSLGFFGLAHLWFAGMGMYLLARRWTGNEFAAAFAGLVFAFNGFTINLLMWPSHIATFSWLPWVVLATHGAWRGNLRHLWLAALAGAMQMLAGGPETIFLTWLIVGVFWLQEFCQAGTSRLTLLWRFPVVVALVIAASAAQLLPFLDLVHHAQRTSGFADLRWSLPGSGWANFFVPMAFGTTVTEGIFFQHDQYWTSSYYLGLATLWLAGLFFLAAKDSAGGKTKAWVLPGIVMAGFILALGENTPVLPLLRRLIPQLSLITYPIKYIMVAVFALPLLAAFTLANLARMRRTVLWPGIGMLIAIAGIMVWTQKSPMAGSDAHLVLLNGISRLGFLVISGAAIYWLARGSGSALARMAPVLLLLVAWTDVYTHEPPQNPTVPNFVFDRDLTRQKLALNPQPDLQSSRAMVSPAASYKFVTFSASTPKDNFLAKRLGYCADCNLLDGVPKVDGFFSLTPRENDEVLSLFYTTTNANYPNLEDFLGVSQITAPDSVFHWEARTNFLPPVTAGLKPIFADDADALSRLQSMWYSGRVAVYLPPEDESAISATNGATATVKNYHIGNNTMDAEVAAAGPAMVVFAETYYHNWHATMDGGATPVYRANVGFMAVQVPAGTHAVHFAYRDGAFELGTVVSGVAWLGMLAGIMIGRKK